MFFLWYLFFFSVIENGLENLQTLIFQKGEYKFNYFVQEVLLHREGFGAQTLMRCFSSYNFNFVEFLPLFHSTLSILLHSSLHKFIVFVWFQKILFCEQTVCWQYAIQPPPSFWELKCLAKVNTPHYPQIHKLFKNKFH